MLMSEPRAVDLGADRSAIDAALARIVESGGSGVLGGMAHAAAVRYAARTPGKRLRGTLVLASFRASGGAGDATNLAAAAELLHGYSLVHDDLPCMDDDDVRRGRPTMHRAFGVETAVVAGIMMIPLATSVAAAACESLGLDAVATGRVLCELLEGVGARGMIGGQLADLAAEEVHAGTVAELDRIHRRKTGALIAACARAGARAAAAPAAAVDALGGFASDLGLAFQIIDDVLDVTGSSDALGKTTGRDVTLGKSTYPALVGVERAAARAAELVRAACDTLHDAGLLTPELRHLADITITRSH